LCICDGQKKNQKVIIKRKGPLRAGEKKREHLLEGNLEGRQNQWEKGSKGVALREGAGQRKNEREKTPILLEKVDLFGRFAKRGKTKKLTQRKPADGGGRFQIAETPVNEAGTSPGQGKKGRS